MIAGMTYPQLIFAILMGIIVGLILSGVIVFASAPTINIPLTITPTPLPVKQSTISDPFATTSGFDLIITMGKILIIVSVATIMFVVLSTIGILSEFRDSK
jgi:hypothetical protein